MKYIEGKIHTTTFGSEQVFAMLLDFGIENVSVQDPKDIEELLHKKNEYDWDYIDADVLAQGKAEETLVVFYLEDTPDSAELLSRIRIGLMKLKSDEYYYEFGKQADLGRLYCETNSVDDADWKDKWKAYFKPAKISKTLVVCPSWEEYAPETGEKVIRIDPGMAFGTGTHETTSMCVRLMEQYLEQGQQVLDVGSGSGILSIAAVLLGAGCVLGVEIDPQAVEIGRENTALNGLTGQIRIEEGNLADGVDFAADLIVANLMVDLVKKLSPAAYKTVKPGGYYISSGILQEKEAEAAEAIQAAGFSVVQVLREGEWCAIAARKIV